MRGGRQRSAEKERDEKGRGGRKGEFARTHSLTTFLKRCLKPNWVFIFLCGYWTMGAVDNAPHKTPCTSAAPDSSKDEDLVSFS